MAGLNFVGNAAYAAADENSSCENGTCSIAKTKVAQFEFIPWILSLCATVAEAKEKLNRILLVDTPFSSQLPVAQLHWIIADKNECIVVESMADGMHVYDNPVGVLTNNPPFPYQMAALNNYRGLSTKQPENTFAPGVELSAYSRGMGGLGLPGDLSSQSRFVRVAFTKLNSKSDDSENASVSQFFHILGSVDQQRGLCEVTEGKYEITLYTSCCNCDKGIYYYTTYDNSQITLNGIVAGLYAAITILTASFAYGNIQFRISEALMMLLLFEPHLTIGLTIGCLIANLFSTVSVLDIVIGTAATLLACLLTTRIKKPWLAPLPTILVNAVMVGAMLSWLYMPSEQFWYGLLVFGGEVGAGEAAVLYVLGIPLYYAMKKTNFIEKLLHPKH